MFEEYCQKAYTNHVCNKDCDSAECGWDGGDCLPSDKQSSYMEQVVVLVIKNSLGHQRLDLSSLGKRISQLFGSESVIQVHPDNWFSNLTSVPGFDQSEGKDINSPVLKLYLKILNNHCQSRCFTKGQYAARFLEAAIQNGWDPGIQLVQVGGRNLNLSMSNSEIYPQILCLGFIRPTVSTRLNYFPLKGPITSILVVHFTS